jgi:hypothetical protein
MGTVAAGVASSMAVAEEGAAAGVGGRPAGRQGAVMAGVGLGTAHGWSLRGCWRRAACRALRDRCRAAPGVDVRTAWSNRALGLDSYPGGWSREGGAGPRREPGGCVRAGFRAAREGREPGRRRQRMGGRGGEGDGPAAGGGDGGREAGGWGLAAGWGPAAVGVAAAGEESSQRLQKKKGKP